MMDDRIAAGRGKVAAVVRVMAVVTVGVKKVGRDGGMEVGAALRWSRGLVGHESLSARLKLLEIGQ